MSPASLLTYSLLPQKTNSAGPSPRKLKTKTPVAPKQGAEMKCAAPKGALPQLSPYKP